VRFDYDIDPSGAVTVIEALADRSEDLKPAMQKIRDLMVEGHKKNFESRGSFLGASWAPLSAQTTERKARQGLPQDAMQSSGALLRALSGGRGRLTSATKTQAKAGVRLFYARFHLAGASGSRRGELPARPVVGMNQSQVNEANRIIRRFLDTGRI
jgi:phage gpG-like protein